MLFFLPVTSPFFILFSRFSSILLSCIACPHFFDSSCWMESSFTLYVINVASFFFNCVLPRCNSSLYLPWLIPALVIQLFILLKILKALGYFSLGRALVYYLLYMYRYYLWYTIIHCLINQSFSAQLLLQCSSVQN